MPSRAPAPKRPAMSPVQCSKKAPRFPLLQGRLAVMTGLAQALVVGRVDEQRPAPPVRLDVVHYRGPDTVTTLGALAAERLPQKLCRAEIICPDGQAVPAVVLRRGPAGRFLGLVLGAVRPPGSGRRTPGVGMAGAALRPRAITSGQNKKRPSHDTLSGHHWLRRWSLWTLAQAHRYSQRSPVRSVCTSGAGFGRSCLRGPSGVSPLAHRADHPSIPHAEFTTTHVRLQIFLPPSSENLKRIYLPPRLKRIEKPILFFRLRRRLLLARLRSGW